MLTRGFIHRSRWHNAALTFVLGVGFCFAGNSVFESAVSAQFRAGVSPTVGSAPAMSADQLPTPTQGVTPEIPDQHPKPAPTIAPIEPRVDPIMPKIDQTTRNQIVEKHIEQFKSGNCPRKLEERRRALQQQHRGGSRGSR